MSKELIRNGSFERGDIDFWYLTFGTASIETTTVHRGTYSLKIIAE